MADYEVSHYIRKELRHKIVVRIIIACLLILSVPMFTIYAMSSLTNTNRTFEIESVSRGDKTISLCDKADFSEPTVMIKSQSVPSMTNISWINDLPSDIDEIDGSHNGENYFAHTFYLRNMGSVSADIEYSINILGKAKGAEKAMWVRVYHNGSPVNYAHAKEDGSNEFGTQTFFDESRVVVKTIHNVQPSQTHKFTVVVWLEGNDEDCVDAIRGGYVRFGMKFSVLP